MIKLPFLAGVLLITSTISAQVGIGTLTPNTKSVLELNSSSKGLLLPRMTSTERINMALSAADAGMMVYQTTSPKGPYTWDGTTWIYYAPNDAGVTTGSTIRWDGSKWAAVTNLFNQGTSIGIGTQNPNTQLQINSNSAPTTRLQFTNSTTGTSSTDGLLVGITLANGSAHLIQQENKYMWFGTNNIERVRIDSIGRVGIGSANPTATLDVNGSGNFSGAVNVGGDIITNGTFKLGQNGTPLQNIIHFDFEVNLPVIQAFAEWTCDIPCPNTITNAVVYISPGASIDHIMIGYSRVNANGNIQVKFMNVSTTPSNLSTVMLHGVVIQ